MYHCCSGYGSITAHFMRNPPVIRGVRRYYMRRESEWREVSFFLKEKKAYFTVLFFNDERGVIKVGL